ncbi:hypothetical protein TNCV_3541261 [Trichonephila clavipes]|nr:hypothetical protein TNCV_3541261 [Trichonephila clavipes]
MVQLSPTEVIRAKSVGSPRSEPPCEMKSNEWYPIDVFLRENENTSSDERGMETVQNSSKLQSGETETENERRS